MADTPRTRDAWVERFEAALLRRTQAGLGRDGDTTAFRMAHGRADAVGPWVVDVYDRWLLAQSYDEHAEPAQEALALDALAELPFAGVYLKRRPRQANTVTEAERKRRAPERAARGEDAPETLVIRECGVPLEVHLGEGFSTGLFLDQREHRRRLQQQARGRVLNLFAYSCAFGVMGALGGAETVNVDLSKRALEWGKRNYVLNGLTLAPHRFFARDAFEFLQRAHRKAEAYDLVVLDPPSYARAARGRFSADRDYVELCASALSVTAVGGQLLACTNQQSLPEATFEARLQEAAERAGVQLPEVRIEAVGLDFPVAPGAPAHLKAAWLSPVPR